LNLSNSQKAELCPDASAEHACTTGHDPDITHDGDAHQDTYGYVDDDTSALRIIDKEPAHHVKEYHMTLSIFLKGNKS